MAKRKFVKVGQRVFRELIKSGKHKGKPKCVVKGCNNPGQHTGNKRKDGSIVYRKKCAIHHVEHLAKKNKVSVTKFKRNILEKSAKKAGFQTITDYLNSKHTYRCNRLTYCENIDGRLGFVCTTTVVDTAMLEVDHMNNDHSDNRKVNLQTICSCCHRYKTRYFGHYTSLSGIKKVFKKNTQKTKQKRKKSV